MKYIFRLIQVVAKWSEVIRLSRGLIALAILASVLAGIGYTMLIALIRDILSQGLSSRPGDFWRFFALCVVIPVCGFASQALLLHLTSKSTYELRRQLARQILQAPLRQTERLGHHRLLAAVTQDIGSVTELVTLLPQTFTQMAMVAGCMFYFGWLSWKLLLIMIVYMAVGLLSYQLPLLKAFRYFRLAREQVDALYKAFQGLIVGTKELKLNRRRREAFLSGQFEPAAAGLRDYGTKGNAIAMAVSNWGQILFFVYIGLLLFAAPRLVSIDTQILTGYTLGVIFLITPLTMLLNQMPILERAYLAAERIEELGLTLDAAEPESLAPSSPARAWQRLDLVDATHVYRQDGGGGGPEFKLGPVNLTLRPGELLFLIGGNGSGKTTLVKLLMGLYEPDSGEIRLDGRPVSFEERDEYRQMFSAVFFDFYLFERLLEPEAKDLNAEGRKYLDMLELSHKLEIKDGAFSTIELSQGQRKRLALLHAYLEDRPVYVFDEWAADQDPQYKQVFYHRLLPEFKARGKTVIVISHDDRYYGLADRVVKLDSGQVEYDRPTARRDADVSAAVAPSM
ncbi:MAG: cyclic peptide export ABC transporter [Pyrinomonadaceae bacterium]